jgi:membrane protein implicated in regulation of membrane protease activity
MSSPRAKFFLITIDELVLIPIALALIWFFAPDYLAISIIVAFFGTIAFVTLKWYIVYPALQDGSYKLYDLKDMEGIVIATVTPKAGKIKVGQEIWEARCDDDEIPKGTTVRILTRESMRVKVRSLE